MTFYYGTDIEIAKKILTDGFIKTPDLTCSIEVAMKCSEQVSKTTKKKPRIIIIENLPIETLDFSTKLKDDLYRLNNEFGERLQKLHLQNLLSINMKQAKIFYKESKFCLIPMKYE